MERVCDRVSDGVLQARIQRMDAARGGLDTGRGDAARRAAGQLDREPMAQAGGEDRAVDGHADRTSHRAEQVGGRGRGTDLAGLDGVLDRHDEDLRDHPEPDPEDHHVQRRGKA